MEVPISNPPVNTAPSASLPPKSHNNMVVIELVLVVILMLGVIAVLIALLLIKPSTVSNTAVENTTNTTNTTNTSNTTNTTNTTTTQPTTESTSFTITLPESVGTYSETVTATVPIGSTTEAFESSSSMHNHIWGYKITGSDYEMLVYIPYEGTGRVYDSEVSVGNNLQFGTVKRAYIDGDTDTAYYSSAAADYTDDFCNTMFEGTPCGGYSMLTEMGSNKPNVFVTCSNEDTSICDEIALSLSVTVNN